MRDPIFIIACAFAVIAGSELRLHTLDSEPKLPALQHPVSCPVPYSSPAQLVHPDGLLREANCLDPKHGFEWYCADPKRALLVSQDGSKAWCERGPE